MRCANVPNAKRWQAALRQSEEYYRGIVELPLAQICRWRPDTTLTFVNAAYAAAYGFAPNDLIGTKADTLCARSRA